MENKPISSNATSYRKLKKLDFKTSHRASEPNSGKSLNFKKDF